VDGRALAGEPLVQCVDSGKADGDAEPAGQDRRV
jgi:hypothetical protein